MPTGPLRDFFVNLLDSTGAEITSANPLPVTIGGGGGGGTVQGSKTNNAAAPGTNNLGALPGVATVLPPVYIEGNQVAESLDLAGNQRVAALSGVQSLNNRSDTPLGGSATFTPASYDDLQKLGWPTSIEVTVITNVDATTSTATPGVLLQWSEDESTVHLYDGADMNTDNVPFGGRASILGTVGGINVPNTTRKTFTFFPSGLRFLKILYVNGSSAQSLFILRTVYRYGPSQRALAHRYDSRGGSWEVEQSNEVVTDISSGDATLGAVRSTGKRVNMMYAGVILSLIVTAIPSAGTVLGLDVSLEAGDTGSSFTRINAPLTGTYITTTGTYRFLWHPNANALNTGHNPGTVKQAVGFPLPRFWQARVTPQDNLATPYTFSMQSLYVVK